LSKQVTAGDLDVGRVYPALKNIREVSVRVAIDTVNYLYDMGVASLLPKPTDIEACVRSQLYSPHYTTHSS